MTKEKAIKWLNAIEEKYIHGGDEGSDEARREAIGMAIDALQAQQETEKNEPLTMAELLKMDGEPVYLRSDDYPGDCGWYVIKAVDKDEVIFTDGNIFLMSEYGTLWLAYRRKPEEKTI